MTESPFTFYRDRDGTTSRHVTTSEQAQRRTGADAEFAAPGAARPMRFRKRERDLLIDEREAQANCRPFGSVRNVAALGEPTEHERERALADAEREKHHEQSAAPLKLKPAPHKGVRD